MKTGILTFAHVLMFSISVSAQPLDISHTYPAAAPEQPFKIARTWFLPDWQSGMIERSSQTSAPAHEYKCSDYPGTYSEIPPGNICDIVNMGGVICYYNCRLDAETACKAEGYVKTCKEGEAKDNSSLCAYDSQYGKCCNLCAGYTIAEIPPGYEENGSCESCSGMRYKIKPVECPPEYTECQYGPAAGAKSCQTGEIMKYNSCIACLYECTLSKCPAGAECDYEACSGKYCLQQCTAGYVNEEDYWNGN